MTTDEQMKQWEERMKDRDNRPGPHQPPQEQMPWTAKVERALMAQVGKGIRCRACNHINAPKSEPLLYVVRFNLMREMIPLPTYICNNCGTHFSPGNFRRIIKAALQKQEKMVADYQKATGGGGGEGG